MANPTPPSFDINTIWGWLVTGSGLVGAAGIGIWKWMISGRLQRAGTDAQLDVIAMLKEQLALERSRADDATKARDDALDQILQLKNQIFALTIQVQNLERTVKAAAAASTGTGPVV